MAALKTLVLGMGNPFVMDDSVGIRLAEDARRRFGDAEGLSWMTECSTGGLDMLERLAGYERLVVFDAIRTRGGRVGDWYRFDAAALRETRHLSSIHDANFSTALELGRALGMPLPPDEEIHIFAVEILENECFGEALSPTLEGLYPALRDEILAEARLLLQPETAP